MSDSGDDVAYHERTYSLKMRFGVFAWLYDDGTERFPGATFTNATTAQDYVQQRYGGTFVQFEGAK